MAMKGDDKQLNIIFAGTPDFAVPPLRELIASEHRVIAVYTQPDRPSGRGRKLVSSPVKQLAEAQGIPVFQPFNFKAEEDLAALEDLDSDLMIVAAYGLLLPQRALDAPRFGCVNIHASLLPRWRGAAPIQRAVLAGDVETGVTIMQMEAGLDTGPMLLKRTCPIARGDTGGILHDRLSLLGAEALMEALPGISDGSLAAQPQDDELACYAAKLDKSEARIDWDRSAPELDRQVHAFNPWPVAQSNLQGKTLRVWESAVLAEKSIERPGTVIRATREGVDVATGDGLLRILMLQMPGKRAMSAADFVNARKLDGVLLG